MLVRSVRHLVLSGCEPTLSGCVSARMRFAIYMQVRDFAANSIYFQCVSDTQHITNRNASGCAAEIGRGWTKYHWSICVCAPVMRCSCIAGSWYCWTPFMYAFRETFWCELNRLVRSAVRSQCWLDVDIINIIFNSIFFDVAIRVSWPAFTSLLYIDELIWQTTYSNLSGFSRCLDWMCIAM